MQTFVIKSQTNLDKLIQHYSGLSNVYYDDELTYIPIDFKKEYIKINDYNGKISYNRIKYKKVNKIIDFLYLYCIFAKVENNNN